MFTVFVLIWLLIQGVRALRATNRVGEAFDQLPIEEAQYKVLLLIMREAATIRTYLSTAVILLAVIADRLVFFR
jgi:hypothetical protein